MRLRADVHAEPEVPELRLDLALALLATGNVAEVEAILDGLPANLSTDERAVRARARLGFAAQLKDAPPREPLLAAIAADPADLRARHLLGVRLLVEGESEAALEQFLEMLRRDRAYQDQLAKRSLIDAFRLIEDPDLVGSYRRKMASLLF
jgi:putative thioredoxin